MPQSSEGQQRLREVRQSTRSYLKSLRADRARRRGADTQGATARQGEGPAPERDACFDPDFAVNHGVPENNRDPETAPGNVADDCAVAVSPDAPWPDGVQDDVVEYTKISSLYGPDSDAELAPVVPGADRAEHNTLVDELCQDTEFRELARSSFDLHKAKAPVPAETGQDAPHELAMLSKIPVDHELMALPGAGPGLVWMLQKAGIGSLDAMANADADHLRTAMGLVGELLDLRYWIDCAREMTGSAADASNNDTAAQARSL